MMHAMRKEMPYGCEHIVRDLYCGTTIVTPTLTRTATTGPPIKVPINTCTVFLSSINFYVLCLPPVCKFFFVSLSSLLTSPPVSAWPNAGIARLLHVMPRPCHESSRSAIPVVTTVSRQVGVQKRVRCMQGPLIWS